MLRAIFQVFIADARHQHDILHFGVSLLIVLPTRLQCEEEAEGRLLHLPRRKKRLQAPSLISTTPNIALVLTVAGRTAYRARTCSIPSHRPKFFVRNLPLSTLFRKGIQPPVHHCCACDTAVIFLLFDVRDLLLRFLLHSQVALTLDHDHAVPADFPHRAWTLLR